MKTSVGSILTAGLVLGLAALLPIRSAAAEAPTPSRTVPAGTEQVLDRIVIRVGPEIITSVDVEVPLEQLRERLATLHRGKKLEAEMRKARQRHIESLVEQAVLLLEAERQDYTVPDERVHQQAVEEVEQLETQMGYEAFQRQLKREHLTREDLIERRERMVREKFLRQSLLQTKLQEFSTGVEVAEEKLRAYYDAHPEAFARPPRVAISQIFVGRPDPGLPADRFAQLDDLALARIREARAALKRGESFEDAARRYSEHKATAQQGGRVGYIERGDTGMPDFEKKIFERLEPGEISDVIATGRGYFIVRLEDRQTGGPLPFVEVRGRIRQRLMNESSETRYEAWLEQLKEKYGVTYDLPGARG